ncbi:DUF5995 family protein [Acidicapsa dinghuensis]|uniref:DUF5995 family protein n=1 Tax=Acidicapsa dinghuensis TaxID=2218256 RepID=A0ABW1EFG1_9BACT|nr:DUF5995 family protein [Acidicapsa dinghuensis]
MFPYDPQLLALLQTPPSTIPQVLGTMQTIDSITVDGDGLKWFNWLYLQVTQSVESRVSAGGFTDPAFLAELDVQFAQLYFTALKNFLLNQPLPECWQVLFASRNDIKLARIQCAFAGVNAHINHDLAFAVDATCKIRGITPQHGSVQYNDFTNLNTTLDSLIDSAKQTLHLRLLGDLLPPVSHVEDTIAGWSMSAARENAWNNSEILWQLTTVPALAQRFGDGLDGVATVIGKALLVPAP